MLDNADSGKLVLAERIVMQPAARDRMDHLLAAFAYAEALPREQRDARRAISGLLPGTRAFAVGEAGVQRGDGRIEALLEALLRSGCDPRSLERGQRVAHETGQRTDAVLLQLGLVSERQVAEAAADLLRRPLVRADEYPDALPDCVASVSPRFL